MKVRQDISLEKFEAWSGGVDTKERIIEAGKESAFESYIEEVYPEGIDAEDLNDFLWFEEDYIFEFLGIKEEEEETD